MKKIFMLLAAMAVTVAGFAAGNKGKQGASLEQAVIDPDYIDNTLPSFTSLTLPYSGNINFNSTNTIFVPSFGRDKSYPAIGFTFSIPEGKTLNFRTTGADVMCVLSSHNILSSDSEIAAFSASTDNSGLIKKTLPELQAVSLNSGNGYTTELKAGTYTLFIVYYDNQCNFQLQVAEPKSYTDVDYSTKLTLGKTVYGMLGQGEGEFVSGTSIGDEKDVVARGYSLDVEAGKSYTLNLKEYGKNDYRSVRIASVAPMAIVSSNGVSPYVMVGGEFSGTFGQDMVCSADGVFKPNTSGTVRLLMMASKTSIYTIELEEVDLTPKFKEITLPYCNEVVSFASDMTFSFVGRDYYDYEFLQKARAFKFTLSESVRLSIASKNDELRYSPNVYLYADEALTELVDVDYSSPFSLAAGTYYLVLGNGYFDEDVYYYYDEVIDYFCNLGILLNGIQAEACDTPDEKPELPDLPDLPTIDCDLISFENMLAQAEVIEYSPSLNMVEEGTLSCDEALYVKYTSRSRNQFCRVWKVYLEEQDYLGIYHHAESDAWLAIYKEDGEGGYTEYAYNDDGGWNCDSRIVATVEEEGWYYIVATTYSSDDVTPFKTLITGNSANMPNEFVSLKSSKSQIEVEDINNTAEILVKLLKLDIKGVYECGIESELDNYINNWEVSDDRTSATYIPNASTNVAEDAEPLVIRIVQGSGISNVGDDDNISVFAAAGVINVIGAPEGTAVKVFSVMGAQVAAAKSAGELTTLNIPNSGVYIVLVGNKAFKVLAQ